MSNGHVLFLMAFLFLGLGYMGVPVAFALMAGVMIATALMASVVPALRALRIDPINALRGE